MSKKQTDKEQNNQNDRSDKEIINLFREISRKKQNKENDDKE